MKRLFLFLTAGILLIAGCTTTGTPATETIPPATDPNAGSGDQAQPEVVALVNGQPITYDTYQRELARFEAGARALGFQVTNEAGYHQQILDLLIDNELIRQRAAAQGVTVSPEAVDAEIQAMITETGEEYFNGWLTANYYTLDEFRREIHLSLVTNQFLEPVIAAVPYEAEQVHARHILLNTQAEAETVIAQINNGQDFAALAAQYSVDVSTRDNGGDLGWFPRGLLLVREVEEVAFTLEVGQISGVVPSAMGFHVIQKLEVDPARPLDEETRDRLIKRAIEEWRLSLRDGADIQQLISLSS